MAFLFSIRGGLGGGKRFTNDPLEKYPRQMTFTAA